MKVFANLCDHHLIMLHESSISDEVIETRGYRTIRAKNELISLGFSPSQARPPGLLLPLYTTDGRNGTYIYRPDNPRVFDNKRKKKLPDGTYPQRVIKYEFPKGTKMALDCPPKCQPMLGNPAITLWITEGQKKGDALASRGLCTIALLGVWNWRGRNDTDGLIVLPDWNHVALNGRQVNIVFDSDALKKPGVRKALEAFKSWLQFKQATVGVVYLPQLSNGKTGVDDYLADGHTIDDLLALVEAPRPVPQPAAPIVELLDAPPLAIRRPLALVDGQAYAAAWLYVKITKTEGLDKEGNIIKHNPPIIETDHRLFILDSTGKVYGPSGDAPLETLGIEVNLPEIPLSDRLMSAQAVKFYRAGKRPNPAIVFNSLVDVIGRFIDFDRSLGDQQTMAEMVACYTLATWFLDAFNVVGFLWPNGEKGSGKTQLITIVAELAYLGQVILAGGSFASLRDLADYGATLAFDDAENFSDPKRTDPDKRALLLAGNRRGNTVPLKEPAANGTWRTRYVNTFCPRLFSAIRLPDEVLASRTIIVPLVRTPDRHRANADVLEYDLWPHDRRKLIDDLWMLALARLAALSAYEKRVNSEATLTGRNLEPWRALLAVALWLDENGVTGLWKRMEALSQGYQSERPELESSDLSILIIKALWSCVTGSVSSISSISSINLGDQKSVTLATKNITKAVRKIAEDTEADIDVERITSRRVGRTLGKMRLKSDPNTKVRGWIVTADDLQRLGVAYGLTPLFTNATNATNASNATFPDDSDLLQSEI